MAWWKSGLYDTCSIITLDKMLMERKTLQRHFPKRILALKESFNDDQLHQDTAERMRERVTIQPLPSSTDLATILSSAGLSKALAAVDKLIYTTAIHFNLDVITGDRQLGKALRNDGIKVASMAMVIRELVESDRLTEASCERLLKALAKRKDLILGKPNPTWDDLKRHKFPNR